MCVGRTVSEFERTNSSIPMDANSGKHRNVRLRSKPLDTNQGEFESDLLGVATKYFYGFLSHIKKLQHQFLKSNTYKILRHTTQPVHFIMAMSVLFVAFLMIPGNKPNVSPLWSLAYLGAFSIHYGTQIWMTFVSGLALFFSLSRHTFGSVQQVLFPKYFLLNAILSFITLFVFMKMNNNIFFSSPDVMIQGISIGVSFLSELVVRLYYTPPLLYLLDVKQKIEKEAGVGLEVGKYNLRPLKDCPYYMNIHKSFRRIHMTIAILNILSLSCTTLHLYYLAHKLCSI